MTLFYYRWLWCVSCDFDWNKREHSHCTYSEVKIWTKTYLGILLEGSLLDYNQQPPETSTTVGHGAELQSRVALRCCCFGFLDFLGSRETQGRRNWDWFSCNRQMWRQRKVPRSRTIISEAQKGRSQEETRECSYWWKNGSVKNAWQSWLDLLVAIV